MAKTYTREFKIEAVRLSYQTEKPLGELVADLGISRSSLNRWRREYGEDPDGDFALEEHAFYTHEPLMEEAAELTLSLDRMGRITEGVAFAVDIP